MTSKIKHFFLLILCMGLIGGLTNIPAQDGDSVLAAAGKTSLRQSDVDSLIEFYEWAFETRFTDAERGKFQSFMTADFRRNPAKTRAETDEVVGAFAKIRAADEDVQRRTREVFVAEYIADLRKTANDADSLFMLEIYENAQTANARAVSVDSPSKNAAAASGAASQSLVGKWTRRAGAGGFRDYTGKTKYNSGEEFTFEFFADGSMQYLYKKEVLSIMQCRISENTKIAGRFSVGGGQLVLNLGAGSSVGTNSCEAKGNFKKNLAASTLSKTFVVKKLESIYRPDSPTILCFDGQDGDDCFEKEK